MEMPEECLFEDAEAMKSLMLHVVSVFLLETNLRVFSCSATRILRGQGHYSLEFTQDECSYFSAFRQNRKRP